MSNPSETSSPPSPEHKVDSLILRSSETLDQISRRQSLSDPDSQDEAEDSAQEWADAADDSPLDDQIARSTAATEEVAHQSDSDPSPSLNHPPASTNDEDEQAFRLAHAEASGAANPVGPIHPADAQPDINKTSINSNQATSASSRDEKVPPLMTSSQESNLGTNFTILEKGKEDRQDAAEGGNTEENKNRFSQRKAGGNIADLMKKFQGDDTNAARKPKSSKVSSQNQEASSSSITLPSSGTTVHASKQSDQDPSSSHLSKTLMTSAITESSQGASVEGRAETEHLDSFEGSEFDSKVLPQDAEAPRLATPESAVAKIPPSKVATSLLEPDETISNPFAYDSRSPSPWAEETNLGSQSSDPTRFSTAMNRASASEWGVGKSAQDECAQPDTPSINSNHFSVVSLSSTAPSSAYNGGIPGGPAPNAEEWASPNATRIKRATMTTISGDSPRPLTPKSNGYSEAASNDSKQNYDFLLARLEHQNARLSNDPKAMRASVDGADKLRENFEKLRGQGGHKPRHSRGSSLGKPIAAEANSDAFSGRTSTQDADIRNLIINPVTQTVEPASFKRDSQRASVGASLSDDLDDEDEAINWEFWGNVMSNYQQVARSQPRELSKAIQAGIPAALRGMMWQLMSGSKDEEMEIIYAYYLKQTSPHEKAIRRDLNRTFPEQDYFQEGKGVGQENLFNVVKAYSLYDPECGYCQGMQFVVGPLLLNMPDEEAFSTLVRLMKSYDLRGHYTPNMPSLQLRLFQFDRLLEEFLPLLHMHLVRQGVKSSMYASQWFMTLFSYRFPLDLVYRILDSVFAEGVEALFRFALALMKKNEDQLLKLNFEQAVNFLKQSLFDIYLKPDLVSSSPSKPNSTIPSGQVPGNSTSERQKTYKTNEFVKDAFQIKITPYMLDTYASEFDEQIRAANAHRREVDALRLVNRNLAAKVKSLEEQLGAVNAEHVDLVKQVVMAKIAKEEMAEELVRYKVMYAEAVLQADQELSARCSVNRSSSATSSSKQ